MEFRFVIVEPHASLLPSLERVLASSYAAEVVTFTGFGEAIQDIRATPPDLILAAVGYEAEDLQFLRALDADESTRRTPIVALTSFPGTLNEEGLSYERYCDARLTKPFETADLVTRVDRLLRLRRDPDVALLTLGVESADLDYKETLDLQTRDGRASVAKDVIAMANSGGGKLVVGIREDRPGIFVQAGLSEAHLEALEPSRLNRALQDFLDPPLSVGSRTVRDKGKAFCIIDVPPAGESIVLARRENDRANLRQGRVYARTSAVESAEVRTSAELRSIIERIIAARIQREV